MSRCLRPQVRKMTRSLRVAATCTLFFATPASSSAQEWVIVDLNTNVLDAVLFADSLRIRAVRPGLYQIPSRTRVLRLSVQGDDWSVDPLEMPLRAEPGDTVHANLAFPLHHRIESVPHGARAFLTLDEGRVQIGQTPVVYTSTEPPSGSFVLEHGGYMPAEITPGRDVWNQYVVEMRQLAADEVDFVKVSPHDRRYRWIDWSAAFVAVAAGAASVHYKFRADRLDDQYRSTGDPALRPDIAALDDRAGLSLGLMQAGLGVLAVRFILR